LFEEAVMEHLCKYRLQEHRGTTACCPALFDDLLNLLLHLEHASLFFENLAVSCLLGGQPFLFFT
jgi:hypothetical protein